MTKEIQEKKGEIAIYRTEDGKARIDVTLEEQTVWLTQAQMATLFGKDVRTVSEHISNVYREKELQRDPTIRKFRIVRKEGKRSVERQIENYNLDVIISVGYRVKSQRGTQFRIWATNVLRDHLVKGYTLNEKRLQENKQRLKELEVAVELVEKAKSANPLSASETAGLLTVITEYTRSWLLLHQYDSGMLTTKELHRKVLYRITEDEAKKGISQLRKTLIAREEAGELFGQEKERGVLKGILAGIEQTFGGAELYPSIEEKAAHLLYFIIKDHPFVDGNKRIASLLFIWFLEKNTFLTAPNGDRKINDNALVALALLVAESNPRQKDVLVKLIINLIAGHQ